MPRTADSAAVFDAPPNIALIKYWGVRDRELVLPYNSSLSVTLDRLRSRTGVSFSSRYPRDEVVLDGTPAEGGARDAVVRMLDLVRATSGKSERARVVSENNFPTASGLASSASGFAALAAAASAAAGVRSTPQELSRLARRGSGSASRSIFGGFVRWDAGSRADGRDSFARSLFSPDHWPTLVDLVAIVQGAPVKSVRSADAMQATVRTSPEYPRRLAELPRRTARMVRAIADRDAARLFPLVMEECDSFREVCETTVPSLDYLTPTSRAIMEEVRTLNRERARPVVGYTHDAGAHMHLFLLARDVRIVRRRLGEIPGIRSTLLVHPGPGVRPVARPRGIFLDRGAPV